MKNNKTKISRVALTGIFAALALALSFAEKTFLAVIVLPMGIKPGFSNIIVMFSCSALGFLPTLGIALIKSGFTALVSGGVAGFISLCGGFISVLTMYTALKLSKKKLSYIGISVLGSVMHNLGQLIAAEIISGTRLFTGYAPVLLVSGVIFGIVTGTIMNVILPYINKLNC